jgi:hypothetical protein
LEILETKANNDEVYGGIETAYLGTFYVATSKAGRIYSKRL